MQDFHKNDLLDNLFIRYKSSFDETLETVHITGTKMYDFYQNHLVRSFKKDVRKLNYEYAKYKVFKKKERKHDIKIERLNFIEISVDKLANSTFFEKVLYKFKRWRYNRLMRNFRRLTQKYWLFICDAFVDQEGIKDSQEVSEKEIEESKKAVSSVQVEDTTLLALGDGVDETQEPKEGLLKTNERERQKGVLEALFGNEDCGENDVKEEMED